MKSKTTLNQENDVFVYLKFTNMLNKKYLLEVIRYVYLLYGLVKYF